MQNFFQSFVAVVQKSKNVLLGILGLLAVLIVFAVLFSGGAMKQSRVTSGSVFTNDGYYAEEASLDSVSRMKAPTYGGAPASTPSLPADKKIIKNGSLSLLVKNADESIANISAIAGQNGGFVENSSVYEASEGVKSGSVTVRVPSSGFDQTMSAIKDLAVKVKNENTNSRDVTAEYIDLEAQIKNYQAEERQYQAIMDRAVKIEDVLNVASRLADVRGRIERTQGQLNYLSRQVDMSTISVSLTAEPEVKVFGIVWRPLTVLKQSAKSLLADLAGFVDWAIKFVFKIPVYLLRLAVAVVIVWALWRILLWTKRKLWR